VRATLRWAHADLRTHRGEALFIVLATTGIVASLLLATALFGYATNPWQRVFTQSQGAHVWIHTGPSADARELAEVDGVTSVAGPYPTAAATVESRGTRASVELRGIVGRPATGRPLLTSGRWLDPAAPDGVVLESSLARALWAEPGDTLTVPGTARTLTVLGVADSAEPRYSPGERPGLVWALPSAVRQTDGRGGQVTGLRLTDPGDTDYAVQRAVTLLGAGAVTDVSHWQQARSEAQGGNRLLGQVLGLFGLGALVAAALAVHGAIGTRIRGHLRDISVLKAIGFTPGQVVRIFLLQHVAFALLGAVLATVLIQALGSRVPGRLGDAVGVWQGLPGHTAALLAVPVAAVLFIAATTGLAAWRAGQVPPVPGLRAAAPLGGRLSGLARGALGLRLPSALVLGWHKAFSRRPRSLATLARLALPLLLIVVAMSAWTTIDRFQTRPDQIGLAAALTVRADETLTDPDVRALLARNPQVDAVHPGVEVAALVPGQTGTIALRGLGTHEDPYPFSLAEGRPARGPDEAVAGQGLLDLLDVRVGDLGADHGGRAAADPAHRRAQHRAGEQRPGHLHLARHPPGEQPGARAGPLPAPAAPRRGPAAGGRGADRGRARGHQRARRAEPGRRALTAARSRRGTDRRTGPDRPHRAAHGDRRHGPRGRAGPPRPEGDRADPDGRSPRSR
jgi:putative ABC transport system permease protein